MTPLIQAVFFDLGDTLVLSEMKKWLPGAKEVLAALAGKGILLGVLSNTGNLTRAQLKQQRLPADFDFGAFQPHLIFLSQEVGIEKPDPEIFRKAVAASGKAAAECLYCSEELVETLVAQHVGMRALRVKQPPGGDLLNLVTTLTAGKLIAP